MKRNTLNKYSKIKIISLVTLIVLIFSSVALYTTQNKASSKSRSDYDLINRNTFISTNKNGELKIKRDMHSNEVPMANDDSWTIFLYMTGTNLESQYSSATTDFNEILAANYNIENKDNLNIVIQTGGCSKWHSNNISNSTLQRYIATENNTLALVDEKPLTSMGDPSTLYDFLSWGISNYPAKNMGVIFWNHGSGVDNGVCQDPLFNNDPLTLNEIEYSFAKTNKLMTTRFDFIGFDTCLSGSVEYANILAPYAKYMIASADLEPSNGWYYTPMVNAILDDPSINGLELGKVICDSYAQSYIEQPDIYNSITMSVFNLSEVDDVCIETNYLTKYMYDQLKSNDNNYFTFSSNLRRCTLYSNTAIDIGSLLTYFDNTNEFDYNSYFYRKELNEFISYSKIGKSYLDKNCLGLSLYYPNSLLSLSDLENIRNTVFSPYWLQFIERICYRRSHDNMDGFKEINWYSSDYFYENTFDFLNYYDHSIKSDNAMYSKLMDNDFYVADGFPLGWKNNFSYSNNYYNTPFVLPSFLGFNPLPIARNSSYNITETHINASIKLKNKNTITRVLNSIFVKDNENLIFLGENVNLEYDFNNNIVSTSFHPEWLCLPDGQVLTTYILSRTKNSTTYGIPVYIDDVESTIRCVETKNPNGSYSYKILGVWDSTNNTKHAGRSYLPLKPYSTIAPIYDVYNTKTKKYSTIRGKNYVVPEKLNIISSILNDGSYYYSFNVEAINGLNYITGLNEFTIKDSILVK